MPTIPTVYASIVPSRLTKDSRSVLNALLGQPMIATRSVSEENGIETGRDDRLSCVRRRVAAVGQCLHSLREHHDGQRAGGVANCHRPQPCRTGRSLLDRPWFILGLLFLVTAMLGLPLLWMSRGFSRSWKIVLSVAVTLYTAALLWGFWLIMNWSVSRIIDSLR